MRIPKVKLIYALNFGKKRMDLKKEKNEFDPEERDRNKLSFDSPKDEGNDPSFDSPEGDSLFTILANIFVRVASLLFDALTIVFYACVAVASGFVWLIITLWQIGHTLFYFVILFIFQYFLIFQAVFGSEAEPFPEAWKEGLESTTDNYVWAGIIALSVTLAALEIFLYLRFFKWSDVRDQRIEEERQERKLAWEEAGKPGIYIGREWIILGWIILASIVALYFLDMYA